MTRILGAEFTRHTEKVIANTATLQGVDPHFMIVLARYAEATKDQPLESLHFTPDSTQRLIGAFTTLPPTSTVLFPSILSVRNGDSVVTSAIISEELVQELGLENGSLVDIEVDVESYNPEHGLSVRAAKLSDEDDAGWVMSAEFS